LFFRAGAGRLTIKLKALALADGDVVVVAVTLVVVVATVLLGTTELEVNAGQADAGIKLKATGAQPTGNDPLKTASTVPPRLQNTAEPLWKAALVHASPLPVDEKVVEISPMEPETANGWKEVPVVVDKSRPPLLSWPFTRPKTAAEPQFPVDAPPPPI